MTGYLHLTLLASSAAVAVIGAPHAMTQTGRTAFVAGPLPSSSYAAPDAPYSGLLECPMTSRVTKLLDAEHFVQLHKSCSDEVTSEAECHQFNTRVLEQSILPFRYHMP